MKEMHALKRVNWHSSNSDRSMIDKLKDFFSPQQQNNFKHVSLCLLIYIKMYLIITG